MSKKHFKNRIRILNDYQATKDPNFRNFPLGTDRSWNYSHTKNTFIYIHDEPSRTTVSFKAFLTDFSIDINYNLEENAEQLDGVSYYDKYPGFKYNIGLQVPAVSLNDAKVNSARIEAMMTMVSPTWVNPANPFEELKYVVLGNLVQNGKITEFMNFDQGIEIAKYGVPCFINKFKYDIDVETGFFESYEDDNIKLFPKNYKISLELFASTQTQKFKENFGARRTIEYEAVLANTSLYMDEVSAEHGEISKKRSWPFGVSVTPLVGQET